MEDAWRLRTEDWRLSKRTVEAREKKGFVLMLLCHLHKIFDMPSFGRCITTSTKTLLRQGL
jgi:hypothetical protein